MKKFTAIILSFIIILSFSPVVYAGGGYDIDAVVSDTADYIYKAVSKPQVGSVGGEWAVLGLAGSGENIPHEYFENYYQTVEKYVKDHNGILHNKKYTEYSRVIVALSSIGKNPGDVAGYNLLTPLGDYEKTIWQGVNGAIWALIALDCKDYEIPQNPDATIQATREMYVNHILQRQTPDGGWALSGDTADADVTGMALQALSKYQDNDKVKSATEKALGCLSAMQMENGGFSSYDTENSESSVQVMVALCELGIPLSDTRFVKNGNTILDNLMLYYDNGNGFNHTTDASGSDLMSTEQAFYGIVAVKRQKDGKSSLYRMSDWIDVATNSETGSVLKNKNADVKKLNIINSGKTFGDIAGHKDKTAIEALASREIINGKAENSFEPDSTMTRAEFATIITKGLGLPQKNSGNFTDVKPSDWFYTYVGTAYHYGIIKGVSENEFNPSGAITREEAAVMVTRAASLCGMDTEMDVFAIRDVLAQFFDYVKASDWSQSSLAFCYDEKILDDSVMDIKPKKAVTRAEIASMLYNMLSLAKLM